MVAPTMFRFIDLKGKISGGALKLFCRAIPWRVDVMFMRKPPKGFRAKKWLGLNADMRDISDETVASYNLDRLN